ncbi:glycosyl hydrolase 53 family protein [Hymenobacter properus]|uniref:Arabinogalactan endo-beta-1,4-galactanase n=1 Tax=Hymenobacter properus TaxID=2791026 RepID=A0A931BKW0_9BACT|nr:glycosyl hydrolase 53 family protein [Hymenobacter properus]MBF9143212.1 glycosyl hydrolase 53 family protein [Hymenobacter properus]MBR7722021.1 glycosyl hydrolase 53 family protein [Microvirga sp. SRT04]
MNNLFKKLAGAFVVLGLGTGNLQAQTGKPTEIQVTPYKTTMLANGKDEVLITAKLIDRKGQDVPRLARLVTYKVLGDAKLVSINGTDAQSLRKTDSTWQAPLSGTARIMLRAGTTRRPIKFEAKADSLGAGATEIHLIRPGQAHQVTRERYRPQTTTDKILGADISFLPQLEARGIKFSDHGVEKDAIAILKEHGFNYVRLRIFNNPAQPKGYSPQQGFCDLAHTKAMAKRVKAAGMKLLLDFHYSDYWADPQQQNKPAAWVGLGFGALKDSVQAYTQRVMQQLKNQGTEPDMVQIGNEINHGMIWPEGHVNNLDSLSQLLYAGFRGVKAVSPRALIMVHVALGGQAEEAEFFYNALRQRNVPYDIIGLSYYPKWHGTLADLKSNIAALAKKYDKQIMVAEYTHLKREVNDIAFSVPGGKGIGSFIWEPLNTWEAVFDRTGKANELLDVYPAIAEKYLK